MWLVWVDPEAACRGDAVTPAEAFDATQDALLDVIEKIRACGDEPRRRDVSPDAWRFAYRTRDEEREAAGDAQYLAELEGDA